MSDRAIFWAGLMGAMATIPLVQMAATAATVPEIAQTAKAITVQIIEPGSVGSGVLLQRQGDLHTVLTSKHVLKAKGVPYTIATSDGKKYQAITSSIRLPSVDVDLAVVKFRASTNYPIAKLGNCNLITEGMDLYVGGYPAPTVAITKSVFLFKKGIVTSNSTLVLEKGYSLIYDNQTLPGMSGGAVLNQNAELVAIHGRGDRDRDSDGIIGGKNGNNLGIPINRFASIASSVGVDLEGKVAAIPQTTVLKAGDYYALAAQKYKNGDVQGSLVELNRAIQLDPNYTIAYIRRGVLRGDKLNDNQGALVDFNRAIQLSPNYALAYYNRGVLKADKLDDPQSALANYDRAIQLDPNYALAYMGRGNLKQEKLNDNQGAVTDYDRAIQLDPNYALAYYNRGVFKQAKLNDNQGALTDYNRAIQLNPNDTNAYMGRGILRITKLDDHQGALADYNRAIQLDPNDTNAYYNRGVLKQYKRNDNQSALADYNRAIQLDPNYANAYGNRGVLKYDKLNNRSGGIRDMQKAARLFKQQNNESSYQKAIDFLKKWGASVIDQDTGF